MRSLETVSAEAETIRARKRCERIREPHTVMPIDRSRRNVEESASKAQLRPANGSGLSAGTQDPGRTPPWIKHAFSRTVNTNALGHPYATPGLLSPMVKTSEGTIYPIFRAASHYLTAYEAPGHPWPLICSSYFPWPNMCGRPMLLGRTQRTRFFCVGPWVPAPRIRRGFGRARGRCAARRCLRFEMCMET